MAKDTIKLSANLTMTLKDKFTLNTISIKRERAENHMLRVTSVDEVRLTLSEAEKLNKELNEILKRLKYWGAVEREGEI